MGSKNKLKRFHENETFPNVIQPTRDEVLNNFSHQGKWHSFFNNNNPISIELGCGKGEYTIALAEKNPNKNFIGIDIKGARFWRGAKTALENKLTNVAFIRTQIELVDCIFDKGEVDEIWITFPDPQIKYKRTKHRMTNQDFLLKYNHIWLGDYMKEIEGALWNGDMLQASRVNKDEIPDLTRIVVAIDPSVTGNAKSDETGIVVAGRCSNGKFYVLEDRSLHGSPDTWAREAVHVFHKYNADRLIAEVNNGGDLVERVVRTIDRQIPYTAVRASRGKIIRAEPIAALYEQGKVHHVGEFKALEDQLTSFTPEGRKSPDRLDALVWALTDLTQQTGQPIWRIS